MKSRRTKFNTSIQMCTLIPCSVVEKPARKQMHVGSISVAAATFSNPT